MKIIIAKDYKNLSKVASEILIKEIKKNPKLTLGLPTGSTPLGLYKELIKAYKKKKINFSKIRSFNLDEYYPIKKSDKNSYHYYMFKNFFNHVNIKKENINVLNGETKNPKKECLNYRKKIEENPIDVQILGVGMNGHVAFDEPGSKFNSKTRLVKLSSETLKSNSRFFKNPKDIPKKALTVGIKTIFSTKKIILLASGKNKALAIKHLIEDKPKSQFPVTFLKKHKNLTLILDKEAASLLS